jgi:YidC/Oxa1 family membrane protein insertase
LLKKTLGNFVYSATLPSAKAGMTTIENELVKLTIANKGGYIVEAFKFENRSKGFRSVSSTDEIIMHLNVQLLTQIIELKY